MRQLQFKCLDCGTVFDYWRKDFEDAPLNPECTNCKQTNTLRKYSMGSFDIAEGSVGNSSSGYGDSITYHCSKFGRFKSKK